MSALPIPPALLPALLESLRAIGDSSELRSASLLGGGCINHAMHLQTGQNEYLLKWNSALPGKGLLGSAPLPPAGPNWPGLFEAEADGLRRLAATHTVRVPQVYAVGPICGETPLQPGSTSSPANCPTPAGEPLVKPTPLNEESAGHGSQAAPAFILLEWLSGPQGAPARQDSLGAQLAELHRQGSAPRYGLDSDNYLGSVLQRNTWQADWPTFFAGCRLRPQIELARSLGRLPAPRARRLERLLARLPDLLAGSEHRPALIHGDLWGGNVIPGPTGLALIDPAVYYADREAEIAYTELFGGFSAQFYAGYQSAWPLDPGYPRRRDLYNLYHLLNHLNHFGESYGHQVDSVIQAYI